MSSQPYSGLIGVTLLLALSANPIAARAQQKSLTVDQTRIVETVHDIRCRLNRRCCKV